MNKLKSDICDKCFECENYWQNNDIENECEGAKEPCHEFRKDRYSVKGGVADE